MVGKIEVQVEEEEEEEEEEGGGREEEKEASTQTERRDSGESDSQLLESRSATFTQVVLNRPSRMNVRWNLACQMMKLHSF
jgi:hypothetical protein